MPFKDADRRREYGRDWMKRNAEKAREAMRRWRASHRSEHAAARDLWDATHPEAAAARRRRYALAHPEVVRTKWTNRRARVAAAEGSYTTAEWLALVARYSGRCAYRGEEGPLQPDHRIPLARGGSNRIENILPACGRCNREKHVMTEKEFRARLASERRDELSP